MPTPARGQAQPLGGLPEWVFAVVKLGAGMAALCLNQFRALGLNQPGGLPGKCCVEEKLPARGPRYWARWPAPFPLILPGPVNVKDPTVKANFTFSHKWVDAGRSLGNLGHEGRGAVTAHW